MTGYSPLRLQAHAGGRMDFFPHLPTLDRLWKLAARNTDVTHNGVRDVFGDLGLELHNAPLKNVGYRNTPLNTSTFASTGGDGIHYGLIHVGDQPTEQSPVVMTVPIM